MLLDMEEEIERNKEGMRFGLTYKGAAFFTGDFLISSANC